MSDADKLALIESQRLLGDENARSRFYLQLLTALTHLYLEEHGVTSVKVRTLTFKRVAIDREPDGITLRLEDWR